MLTEWKQRMRSSPGTNKWNPRTSNYHTSPSSRGLPITRTRPTRKTIHFLYMLSATPTTRLNFVVLSQLQFSILVHSQLIPTYGMATSIGSPYSELLRRHRMTYITSSYPWITSHPSSMKGTSRMTGNRMYPVWLVFGKQPRILYQPSITTNGTP